MAVAKFSGLASGIDSASLIDALIEARQSTNQLRKKEIAHLNSQKDSVEQLNTKVLALYELIDKFRTVNGGGVSKRSSSSDSTVVTSSVSGAANPGSIPITVSSVASAGTASFDDTYSSPTSLLAPSASGSVSIGVDIGTGPNQVSVDVAITSSTTVSEFVDSFNENANASGRVNASLINVGTSASPSYRVVFTGLKTGLDSGSIAFDIPSSASFGGTTQLQSRSIDQATNATFVVDGISGSITRASNTISDVFNGVTFQLNKNGSATVNVATDVDSTFDGIKEVIEAYNDLVRFVVKNDSVDIDNASKNFNLVFGSLARTTVDNEFLAEFRSLFAAATSGGSSTVRVFADLGITTNRDGTLTINENTFKSAVGADASGATDLFRDFADSAGGVDGVLYRFTKYQGYFDIAQTSADTRIETLNSKIEQLERQSEKMRQTLEQQFARLESTSSRLQSQQAQLTSILG